MELIIKKFLSDRLLIEFGDGIDDTSDLFQLGLMDSHTYIQLIRFVESKFQVRFEDEELLSNVTASVAGLAALISGKLGER